MGDEMADETTAAPPLLESFACEIGGRAVDTAVIETGGRTLFAAAEGSTIHLLDLDGNEVKTLATDADMRVVHWWPEAELLLAGCKDEKVIAFQLSPETGGTRRRWEFVSQMDPWLYTNKASHWWKEAGPHHAGIHGLTSGKFLDEPDTQAIVGSASTIELLDRHGKLVLRKRQIWGDVVRSIIVPVPDGSRNLLSLRRPSLTSRVNILNSKTLDPVKAGCHTAPSGHTQIASWGRARYHLFHADLDGDGTGEIVGEINGPWDRVGVWGIWGAPIANAPFGPGLRSSRSLRDLDVADLDGDGKQEILVATDAGLLVVLDHQCKKIWSKRLPSPATVFKPIAPPGAQIPWIVVGCADETVLAIDGNGRIVRRGKLKGPPIHIDSVLRGGVAHALFATTKGVVAGLSLGD